MTKWSFAFHAVGMLACFAGLIAMRLKHKIKSRALRSTMIALGAASLFAMAAKELYRLSDGFSVWKNLASINVLVPTGWFLAGCFVLFVSLPHVGLNRTESGNGAAASNQHDQLTS